MLTADGIVKPCCFAPGNIGNLHEASAEAIWNGERALELRRFIKDNRIHPICADAPCKFVQNMRAMDTGTDPAYQGEFDEDWYLNAYPDVAAAVRNGGFASGWQHYEQHGRSEGRQAYRTAPRSESLPNPKHF